MSNIESSLDDGVFEIVLNRPERLNALVPELMTELSDAVAAAAGPEVKAVVLTGSGRGFSTGGDLRAPRPPLEPASRRLRQLYHPAVIELVRLQKPVVAAVNGPVMGAGLSIAAAADIRVASTAAVFAGGFVDVGLAADTGTTFLLSRSMTYADAFHFLSLGQRVDAHEARRIGLVNEVVEPDELLPRAREIARSWAARPGVGIPSVKALLQAVTHNDLEQQLELEARIADVAANHPERARARAAKVEAIRKPGPDA
ncbi:enoyl-CoA hydratase/isomerase family protein [Nocardioides immobilis]|uniref:Enoyl-CoA hydratase/isomerase family protein n=1 Tax=Nocardioides immobilis TaxID=2049295 RepID=A0A417Y0S7_9ACTN|nr:enoyl-CoA hydratase/isomerase family protein [Nocardioides immobilis]RHW26260.1 enoyl-CoA hydratase/isomerase family protein [Nocardioides immobilis]